jgi:glycosyltransferase involved in cell wall biosynthesis
MDVMLVPSRDEEIMRETFSQVMVQGMLSGLPVLASDLPVLREKLDCGGGAVFRDVQELSGLMVRMHEDRSLRAKWSAEARKTALARYVWDTRCFAENFLAGW